MNQSDLNYESVKLLAKIYTWRKKLIIVTVIAAVLSIAISFLMSPQYKATVIVFPSRTFSVSKLLIEQNQGSQEDYMDLGDEDDAEKLLQILNSTEIRTRIADQYDLWSNWDIKKGTVHSQHYLKLKWEDMVSFKRTNFVSIKVEVYDYVAERSAKIANSIVAYADTVKFKMTRQVAQQALQITKDEYYSTIHRINELEDSLQAIKELGVIDYSAEIKAYSKSMAKAVESGNQSGQKNLQTKLDLLKKYGVAYDDVYGNLKKYRLKYPIIKNKYDEAIVNYNNAMPSKFIVDKAIADEKKAKPYRWLIVLLSTSSAFLLAIMYLLFAEKFTELKKNKSPFKFTKPRIMENFKTEDILKGLLPHWKKLTVVALIAFVVGIFISSPMVIKPLYKSYSVVYPVNLSPSSEESTTEQLLQWFNSEEVKKAVCEKFDLYKHYDIDTLDARHQTWFNLKFKERVSINATLYESIEISVKDQSPEMSQKIVNGLINAVNDLIMAVKKERLHEYILNNENELKRATGKVDSLKYMIDNIRKEYNIIDVQYQAKYISKEIVKSPNLSESNAKTAEGLKTKKTELDRLGNVIGSEIGTYNYIRNQIDGYLLDYANKVSFTNVVSKPTLPDSKCYPIRSLVVAIITLSSLLIACIVLVYLNIKNQKVD